MANDNKFKYTTNAFDIVLSFKELTSAIDAAKNSSTSDSISKLTQLREDLNNAYERAASKQFVITSSFSGLDTTDKPPVIPDPDGLTPAAIECSERVDECLDNLPPLPPENASEEKKAAYLLALLECLRLLADCMNCLLAAVILGNIAAIIVAIKHLSDYIAEWQEELDNLLAQGKHCNSPLTIGYSRRVCELVAWIRRGNESLQQLQTRLAELQKEYQEALKKCQEANQTQKSQSPTNKVKGKLQVLTTKGTNRGRFVLKGSAGLIQYYKGDVVTFAGKTYSVLEDVKGKHPSNDSSFLLIEDKNSDTDGGIF